jgi:hypothetical protein
MRRWTCVLIYRLHCALPGRSTGGGKTTWLSQWHWRWPRSGRRSPCGRPALSANFSPPSSPFTCFHPSRAARAARGVFSFQPSELPAFSPQAKPPKRTAAAAAAKKIMPLAIKHQWSPMLCSEA